MNEELLGAIARGYCHPKNENKTLDADLCVAIAEEILSEFIIVLKKDADKIKIISTKSPKSKISVKDAMDTIANAIQNDEGYAIGWKANLAMAFCDEIYSSSDILDHDRNRAVIVPFPEETASVSADRFIKLAFGVNTSHLT